MSQAKSTSGAAAEPKPGSKGKPGKHGKPGKGADAGDAATLSIAADPRATRSVRQIKAWVGLIGFGGALFLSLRAGVPVVMAGERALIAGVAGYVVAWGCAVAVWRALLLAELRARVDAVKAAREQAAAK